MSVDKIVGAIAWKCLSQMAQCLTILLLFQTTPNTAIGQSARIPEFSFRKMSDGSDFTQKQLTKGKKSFFLFFDTECPHCKVAVSTWNENTAALSGLNAVIVTMDKASAAVPFLQKNGPKLLGLKNVSLVQDMSRQFIARFLPKKYPSMFLYSESGSLMHYTDEEKDIPYIISLIRKK
jgi:peroxiredoxin